MKISKILRKAAALVACTQEDVDKAHDWRRDESGNHDAQQQAVLNNHGFLADHDFNFSCHAVCMAANSHWMHQSPSAKKAIEYYSKAIAPDEEDIHACYFNNAWFPFNNGRTKELEDKVQLHRQLMLLMTAEMAESEGL